MPVDHNDDHRREYKKAKDLRVLVKFEQDDSPEGKMRMAQVKTIVCQLIFLARKRGRPSTKEKENFDAAA